MSNFRIADS